MGQAWHEADSSDFQCAQCGAIYEVSLVKVAISSHDEAICNVCQKVMNEWRGNLTPSYKLKYPPERPPSFR